MKKIILTSVLSAVIITAAFSQTGVIREMSGEVTLKYAGETDFIPAEIGIEIDPDTIVSTGFKSTAVIAIGSTTLTVRPLTRLSLSEIRVSSGVENLNVNLQTGRVRVEVKPPSGARAGTSVQTPASVASVRGTEFEMDTRNLRVLDGIVFYIGSDGISISVAAGLSSTVSANKFGSGGGARDPVELAIAELAPASPAGNIVIPSFVPVTTRNTDFEFKWE